ncbi:M15 family metallopeptidase [Glaciimonas immobilis]|uniref:Peptidase M15C domain-containing protein n=1 Tax=Glaciimonas immobilis TaxID=728004 RepID=A0A840S078_9BURK|nr:M15 family metallopeptidase [Glaciimonas immobilis]KAF3997240.1 M15 family metallopeptidase [Glaciimonas immobilis]MBB5202294.1 hypothetical protein [Glaciimonas immobilis]
MKLVAKTELCTADDLKGLQVLRVAGVSALCLHEARYRSEIGRARRWLPLAVRVFFLLLISGSHLEVFAVNPVATEHNVIAQAAGDDRITAIDDARCASLKSAHVVTEPKVTERKGPNVSVDCSRLQIVRFSYLGFDDKVHADGKIMVMGAAAPEVRKIFDLLLARRFPLARARLMDNYQGDDDAAMADNNSSAFNNRVITGGGAPSLHAYGLAIDINPVQNPYVHRAANGQDMVSPPAAKPYTKRLPIRRGMVDDQIVNIFATHGFIIWGGNWHQPIDYQHFQVSRKTAEHLAGLGIKEGRAYFEQSVVRYRRCMDRRPKVFQVGKVCALTE